MDFCYDEKYFKRHYSALFYRRYVDFRNRFIKNEIIKFACSGKFLEIGFGNDNLIKFFKDEFDVFGIDISEFAVKQIQKSYNPANFKVGDISKEKIPFEEKFDVICAINVLEHLENPKFALENVFNSLKKGGVLAIYLPTQSNIFSKIQYKIFYDVKEHSFKPSIQLLRKVLTDLGFKEVKEYAASFIPFKISNDFFLKSLNLYLGAWQR